MEVVAVKVTYGDSLVIVCGDMNGRNIAEALMADTFHLLVCGPTRGDSKLDLFYTNANPATPPLETEGSSTSSNHRCVKVSIDLPATKD